MIRACAFLLGQREGCNSKWEDTRDGDGWEPEADYLPLFFKEDQGWGERRRGEGWTGYFFIHQEPEVSAVTGIFCCLRWISAWKEKVWFFPYVINYPNSEDTCNTHIGCYFMTLINNMIAAEL